MHEDAGGRGRGHGHGRAPHVPPRPHDGVMHEDIPYYESFQPRRPAHNNEGYYAEYAGHDWEYDGYNMGDDGYPPYSYGRHQPYPHYPMPGYGEPGPSRYRGGYNHDDTTVYDDASGHAMVIDNMDTDSAVMEGVQDVGWSGAQGTSNPTDMA
jgi:hypothetical protein